MGWTPVTVNGTGFQGMKHSIRTYIRNAADKRSFSFGWELVHEELVEQNEAHAKFMTAVENCGTAETSKVVWSEDKTTIGEFTISPYDK